MVTRPLTRTELAELVERHELMEQDARRIKSLSDALRAAELTASLLRDSLSLTLHCLPSPRAPRDP